jgi:hypothetical protein
MAVQMHVATRREDLPQDPKGKIPNPIVSRSKSLIYWASTHDAVAGVWVALVGSNGVLTGRAGWIAIGMSLDQESALAKAKARAILIANHSPSHDLTNS